MILIIDNYDSFTYNLVHLVGSRTDDLKVIRNDQITVDGVREMAPEGILISPGPGRPADAGVTEELIRELGASTPILGVCLGHQAIGEVYGGTVTYAPSLMHGKTSEILHDGRSVFQGVPQGFTATRYHSLVVDRATLPEELEVSAETHDCIIMGLRHRSHPVEGIQFHPESVLTTEGPKLIANWLEGVLAGGSREQGAGSREQGAGSREQGAGSREQGAGSREQGAGSREQGAGSREQGKIANSRQPIADSQ